MAFRDLFDSDPRSKKDLRREIALRDETVSELRRAAEEQRLQAKKMLESHAETLGGLVDSLQDSKDREHKYHIKFLDVNRLLDQAQREVKRLKSGTSDEMWVLKERAEEAERRVQECEFELRNLNLRIQDFEKSTKSPGFQPYKELRVDFQLEGEFDSYRKSRLYLPFKEVEAFDKLVEDPSRYLQTFEFRSALDNILWDDGQDRFVRLGHLKVLNANGERSNKGSLLVKLRFSLDLAIQEKFDLSILKTAISSASFKFFFDVGDFEQTPVFKLLNRTEFSLESIERFV